MRRLGRRNARTNPSRPDAANVIRALLPYSFIEADTYTVDGVSGKVASIVDKVRPGTGVRAVDASHAFAQATSGSQVALPAVSAAFGGRLVMTIPAATDIKYESSAAAGTFNMLHTGTGYSAYHVASSDTVTSSGFLLSTYDGTRGAHTPMRSTSTTYTQIWNDAAVLIANIGGTGAVVANTPYVWKSSYLEGGSPEVVTRLSTQTADTASTGAAPGSANSAKAMLFRRPLSTPSWSGLWACTVVFGRILSAGDEAILLAYFSSRYGVT